MNWKLAAGAALDRTTIAKAVPGLALFRDCSPPRLRIELLAALTLWAVVVPQALAYGELARLPSIAGLYTALAGMLLYGLFGSSRYLNVGPESSVAIVVAASVGPLAGGDPERTIALTSMLAILTGGLLLLGALLRLGVVTRLLSTPILVAYLAGSAVIIVASQVPKVFGISAAGDDWWEKIWEVLRNLSATNMWSLGIGLATIVLVVALRRLAPRIPAFLVAMALATVVVAVADLADEHAVAVVGNIQRGVPLPSWPAVGLDDTISLLGPAVSVALLVFASSAAVGSGLAARDREDLQPTREFVGLAVANVGAGLLQGFSANASDTRSFIVAGGAGRTQRVNVLCALIVVITLIALTPLFRNLPIAALAGVVLVSAVKLIDVAQFRRLWDVRKTDFALSVITFLGVLIVGVLGGIAVGVVVSLLEVMRRAIFPHTAVLGLVENTPTYRDIERYEDAAIAPGLLVYRFDAPLFFANADLFRSEIRELVRTARHPVRQIVVSAEGITDMDVTGAEALERLLDDLNDAGVRFVMARVRTSLRTTLRRLGLEEKIGHENFYLRVVDATAGFTAQTGRQAGSPMEDRTNG